MREYTHMLTLSHRSGSIDFDLEATSPGWIATYMLSIFAHCLANQFTAISRKLVK